MLIDFLVQFLLGIASFVVSLFPNVDSLPEFATSMNSALEVLFSKVGILNSIFPVDTLLLLATISTLVSIAFGSFAAVNWILNKIRGSG